MNKWFDSSIRHWKELTENCSNKIAKFEHGHYSVAFQLVSEDLAKNLGSTEQLKSKLSSLDKTMQKISGIVPFMYPHYNDTIIHPDGNTNIYCWCGCENSNFDREICDYWRISLDGKFFLIRGFEEDIYEWEGPPNIIDYIIPILRMGKILLYISFVAKEMGVPDVPVEFQTQWDGLMDRTLYARLGSYVYGVNKENVCKIDTFRSREIHKFRASEISTDKLLEILTEVLKPLYEQFNSAELNKEVVKRELKTLVP